MNNISGSEKKNFNMDDTWLKVTIYIYTSTERKCSFEVLIPEYLHFMLLYTFISEWNVVLFTPLLSILHKVTTRKCSLSYYYKRKKAQTLKLFGILLSHCNNPKYIHSNNISDGQVQQWVFSCSPPITSCREPFVTYATWQKVIPLWIKPLMHYYVAFSIISSIVCVNILLLPWTKGG